MTTLEEAKSRGPERHLTSAYNFAGPGTFYEARMRGSDFYENLMKEAGRKVVGTKPYNKPINKVDACAKIHDATYIDKNASAATNRVLLGLKLKGQSAWARRRLAQLPKE